MWNNNGFGGNGMFPNNFNNLQEEYPQPSPFASSSNTGNGYFPQANANMMPFGGANSAQFNGYHSEVGPFNQDAFMQNQQTLNADAQFSLPALNVPQSAPVAKLALDSYAAELKERLIRGKKARGKTPPVPQIQQSEQATGSGPSTALPKSPLTVPVLANPEQDLHELISSFSEPLAAPEESTKQNKQVTSKANSAPRAIPTGPSNRAKSQELSSGIPKPKPNANGNIAGKNLTSNGNSHSNRGSISDMSEGEILEEPPLPKAMKPDLPAAAKKIEEAPKPVQTEEPMPRKSRDEVLPKLQARDQRDDASRKTPPVNPKAYAQRNREDRDDRRPERRDSFESRPEKRPSQPEHRSERSTYTEHETRPYSRRDSCDEGYPRADAKVEPKQKEQVAAKERIPTLEQLLPHNQDVREWLEITGYHNVEYRNKILEPRRKIAALDAERERLIAQMAAQERGGMRVPTPSMLPPPVPQKSDSSSGFAAVGEAQRDLPVANKRSYSEMDPYKDVGPGKMQRLEDRPRSRDESGSQMVADRREERDYPRYDERRTRRSQSREISPGRRAFESRPPARTRSFDEEREYEGPRPYLGKSYDPNYRGRGRGAGRGRGGGGYPSHDPSFSSRGAHGKVFKD